MGVGEVRESKAMQHEGDFQELGMSAWSLIPVVISFSVTWKGDRSLDAESGATRGWFLGLPSIRTGFRTQIPALDRAGP